MSPISVIAIYFVVWWLTLFAVLPWGARSQADAGEVTPGTEPGAPAVIMRYWKKLLITTVLAGVVVALIFWALTNPVLQEYWR
jgi:predicted secreted protein